ncbi:MAG: hypothetical protein QXD23_02145 [Candidatus Micrarchaeaceae archaeon]
MVVVSEKKLLELIKFEQIIKRCPICIKDTEQTAYYSHKPDLSITTYTETIPAIQIKILSNIGHEYEWYVLATCTSCNYTYKVTGVPKMKEKDIPKTSTMNSIELALTCCDVCYNEYYRYVIGDVFINLSLGGKVYLCNEHAKSVENEKQKDGNYNFLIKKINYWENNKEIPLVIKTKSEELILKRCNGLTSSIFEILKETQELSKNELFNMLAKRSTKLKQSQFDEVIGYLKGMYLIEEKESGSFIKKRTFYLTKSGTEVAEVLKV